MSTEKKNKTKLKISRKYNMQDETMLVSAQVKHDMLVKNLGLFTASFPFINADFATDFQTKITDAEALALDSQYKNEKNVITAELKDTMAKAYAALRQMDTYTKIAYKKGDKHQRAFGQDSWTAARYKKDYLVAALDLAYQKLNEEPFKTTMQNIGFTTAQTDALEAFANKLRTNGTDQISASKNRNISTQERITMYNEVWEFVRKLNLASKVVYAHNPAQQKLYQLYPSPSNKKEENKKEEK